MKLQKKLLLRGQRLIELLKQNAASPLTIYYQIILIYAGVRGYVDNINVSQVKFLRDFIITNLDTHFELLNYDLTKTLPHDLLDQFLTNVIKQFIEKRS